jgi:hypothetical protein
MFQLGKVWIDTTPNPNTVEIRYTWSELGQTPRWNGDEEARVMSVVPNSDPPTRLAILEIPRYLNDEPHYLLHYRFGGGGESRGGSGRDFTEEIVSDEVKYVDGEGRITEVRALWSVDGWNAPNWSQARLEGLELKAKKGRPHRRGRSSGISDEAMYELVRTVPLPRRFAARVWGPKGATVEYAFQLLRTNSPIPEDDFERWDNNEGKNYRLVL